jgi:hypothetical protein
MSQPHFGQVWGWSPTLGKVEGLKSAGTPECSELDSKAQNTSHWSILGVIEKVLKHRYRKWPRIDHSDICSPSYGQKKGWESNWQFDSRPLKVWNRPLPDVALNSATWRWKALDKSYNFGLRLVPIRAQGEELWPFKVPRVQPGQFRDSILGIPTKCAIWMLPRRPAAEYTIRSKVVAYSRVRAVMSFVCPSARGKSQHPRVSRMLN